MRGHAQAASGEVIAGSAPQLPDNSGVTPLAERINALLPQTQCTRCGYPDCASYAEAIASESIPINQCPPGGAEGIERLAAVTGQPFIALNPVYGEEGPRHLAVIDEAWCIGCTLCLDACPTDAILGGNKMMHTVIEAWCTGCELCIPVCPVDCISLENATQTRTGWQAWSQSEADIARARHASHEARRKAKTGPHADAPLASLPAEARQSSTSTEVATRVAPPSPQPHGAVAAHTLTAMNGADAGSDAERKRAVIQAALEKARSRAIKPPG